MFIRFLILFFSTQIMASRGFLEQLDLTPEQIKSFKSCACLVDNNGNTLGQVAGLGEVVDNSLVIFDKNVLTALEKFPGVSSISFKNILERMTGNTSKALTQISSGISQSSQISLPSEEITSPNLALWITNHSAWELHNVVYRPELNTLDRYGELRLIYKIKDSTGLLSRIIFEYKLPRNKLSGSTIEVTDTEWAALFAGLSCLKRKDLTSYISILHSLVNRVTNFIYEGLPCGSALGQLRINDFSSSRWILAEYGLQGCNLERRHLPLTPPDNYYQEIDQSVRSGNQKYIDDDLFKFSLVQYLKGLRESPVVQTATMLSDFGQSSWMKGILGGNSTDCQKQCLEKGVVPGCNCNYISFLSANGINLNDPTVIKKARQFSLNTCNSCHSSCSIEQGCGGVSFFHTEADGRAGNFLANNNGEVDVLGRPIGELPKD